MPCKTDYMEPNEREKEGSKIKYLLEEATTGVPVPTEYSRGMHPEVYNMHVPQATLDSWTADLCLALGDKSKEEIAESSLELQLWWRDHQRFDKHRLQEEARVAKLESQYQRALSKLDAEDVKALVRKGLRI